MRKNLLKTIMPAIAIVFAVAAAFATQSEEVESTTLVPAYIPQGFGQPCQNTLMECDTEIKDNICTYGDQDAFGLANDGDLTSCSVDLYRD